MFHSTKFSQDEKFSVVERTGGERRKGGGDIHQRKRQVVPPWPQCPTLSLVLSSTSSWDDAGTAAASPRPAAAPSPAVLSLHCGTSDTTCVTALWNHQGLWFGTQLGRAKGSCLMGISTEHWRCHHTAAPCSLIQEHPAPWPWGLRCCCSWPLLLLRFPPSPSPSLPLSVSVSLLSQLCSSFLGSVQLADTFATDGWCTRRQLSLPICGPLRDSRADAS